MNSLPRLTIPQITLASAGLIIVIFALTITLTRACGREDTPVAPEPTKIITPEPPPDESGPLEMLAPESFELTVYDIETYLGQDLPDESLELFNDLRQDFSRFGIDLESVDQLVVAVLDCCSYRDDDDAGGQRIYLIDGPIDLDVVRDKLETEEFEPRMDGDNEAWDQRTYTDSFQGLSDLAAAYITDDKYFAIGSVRGIKELLFELSEAPANRRKTHMEQVLALIGNDWKASGRLDAQTKDTLYTHCAYDITSDLCDATAYYTSYNATPLRTRIITTYFSPDDARYESSRLDYHFEYGPFPFTQIRVVNVTVKGTVVEAIIEHREALERAGYGD